MPQTTVVSSPDQVRATISQDSVLTEVAFAIEGIINHFFGRGVFRFEITRSRQSGDCVLEAKALTKSGPIQVSQISSVGVAIQSGLFPRRVPPAELFTAELVAKDEWERPAFATDGQHRFRKILQRSSEGYTESVIESRQTRTDIPLGYLAYGLADLITGLYARGVNYIKWQGSLDTIQLYVKHRLDEKTLYEYLASQGSGDYDINMKVAKLP